MFDEPIVDERRNELISGGVVVDVAIDDAENDNALFFGRIL